MKYRIQYHPNPDCMTIHTNVRLPYYAGDKTNMFGDHPLSKTDLAFIERLEAIEGVDQVTLAVGSKYTCWVIKGSVFSWLDITIQTLDALHWRFDPNGSMVAMPERIGPGTIDDAMNERMTSDMEH